MTALSELWLPILLSAVFVFFVSSILHMLVPLHRSDYRKMPNEDVVRTAFKQAAVPPGQYMFPAADSIKECSSPAMQKKFAEGPVGVVIMRGDGMPSMGKSLGQWFVLCLVVGFFVAYLAGAVLAPGTAYLSVFRVTGAAAFAVHGFSSVNDSIWKGVSWGVTAKFIFDGILYALVTAGTFAWLWPAAV